MHAPGNNGTNGSCYVTHNVLPGSQYTMPILVSVAFETVVVCMHLETMGPMVVFMFGPHTQRDA
jgi:hypothetical protein